MTASSLPILVTGAGGFIGSRWVTHLADKKIPVISVDDPSYFEERLEIKDSPFGVRVDREKLFTWLAQEKPKLQAIVHLGACTDTTELDEAYLARMNLNYSKSLWTYCTEHQIPLLYASSAATYGAGELGYEDDESLMPRLKPLNPYGDSKLQFDLWALGEERAGRTPPTWSGFKFFNVYGFGERHKGKMASVVLHAFDQIQKTGHVKLFKSHREGIPDGHQKRDFIFVDDLVAVLKFARTKPIRRGIFNLGTGQARTFLDLVNATFAALGLQPQIDFIDTPAELRERYQYFTQATMDKLRKEGFSAPFTSLEDGVKKYVQRLLRTSGNPTKR